MRCLTLHQPWATLIALKVKTIETRSWPAPRSLVGQRIAIHAAKRPPTSGERIGDYAVLHDPLHRLWWVTSGDDEHVQLPLGAIVATAVLADCVPMVDRHENPSGPSGPSLILAHYPMRDASWTRELTLVGTNRDPLGVGVDVTDQLPYGHFEPCRWGWLLDGIAPTTERCPACWGKCSVKRPIVVVGGAYPNADDRTAPGPCRVCGGAGRCDPIPAKGRQGVWEWTP